ncbi:uncharacterized protein EAE97_005956 [Botrytis byssoidea]|uniref:Uncharacterized protein n=1 Tax=Botrytis byssoidea TaxID=139641 RepID=A0A9P5M5K9_9HELO|nr:uncharacterized protein EAE97_005956 [Botrytis byssoidea]KAF7943886.1 hypothetical protein EAE97_005956 [Botrytis byssoidea]
MAVASAKGEKIYVTSFSAVGSSILSILNTPSRASLIILNFNGSEEKKVVEIGISYQFIAC